MLSNCDDKTPPPLDLRRCAIFSDFDGALVNLEAHPDDVVADSDLIQLLRAIAAAADGALAIVTGRRAADVARKLDGAAPVVAGLHGGDLWVAGAASSPPAPSSSMRALASCLLALESEGVLGARIEDKGASIALHYRHAPDLQSHVMSLAASLAEAHGLRLIAGKMVMELTPRGVSKGLALEQLMKRPPFAERSPIAIGDDVTDEDAFASAQALGGFGGFVGDARSSCAHWRLPDVEAVRAWLAASLVARRA